MVAFSIDGNEADPAPPGTRTEPTIDIEHLGRMTLGDARLEREVLQLFDRQSEMLVARMRAAPAATAVSCAHTLKGSARNIGAWRIASAAERFEQTAAADVSGYRAAMEQLISAVAEARRAIALRLN